MPNAPTTRPQVLQDELSQQGQTDPYGIVDILARSSQAANKPQAPVQQGNYDIGEAKNFWDVLLMALLGVGMGGGPEVGGGDPETDGLIDRQAGLDQSFQDDALQRGQQQGIGNAPDVAGLPEGAGMQQIMELINSIMQQQQVPQAPQQGIK